MKKYIVLLTVTAFLLMGSMCHHGSNGVVPPPPINNIPVGSLDKATATYVWGWAYDKDAGRNPIAVHVYDGGKLIAMGTANKQRIDLLSVVGDVNHGYKLNYSLTPGKHMIHVYAINFPKGTNAELGGSPKAVAYVPTIPVWKEITGGMLKHVGESLFYMKKFKGELYGATEQTGRIVKFNGIAWSQAFQTNQLGYSKYDNSYHLGIYGDFMYTGFRDFLFRPTSIMIFRTNGQVWSRVHHEKDYAQARFLNFNGGFYTMISTYLGSNRTKLYRKTDPNSRNIGVLVATYPKWLYGDSVVWQGKMFWGGEGIFSVDKNHKLITEYLTGGHVGKEPTITAFQIFNNKLHATFMQGFRRSGVSKLMVRSSQGWETVKYFPEPEAWCMEVYNDKLYLGTRKEGGGGKVYELDKNYKSKVVGTTKADGFFSLRKFQGKLFAGTYSQQQVRSYMFYYK